MDKQIRLLTPQGNEYLIEAEDLEISEKGRHTNSDTISFLDAKVYKNGKELTDFGKNFAGSAYDIDDVVSELIRSYINGGVNDIRAVEVFNRRIDEVKASYEKEQVTARGITRNRFFMGKYDELYLDMISKDGMSYYSNVDACILLRKDMSVATDMEFFYTNEFTEEIQNNNYDYIDKQYEPYL